MVKSLKKICLKSVCFNLSLNYKICKKYEFKLCEEIGDEILKYVNGMNIKVSDDDAKLFKKNITDLSRFECKKEICGGIPVSEIFNVRSYDFLNDHHLKELSLTYTSDFRIESSSFSIFTEKLSVNNVTFFMDSNDEEIESFFKDSLHVTKSIIFNGKKFTQNKNPIALLIGYCFETLKTLMIDSCLFKKESFFHLIPQIFHLKNLQEFSFIGNYGLDWHEENLVLDAVEEQNKRQFGRKLTTLKCSFTLFALNSLLFENLKNLEHFSILGEINTSYKENLLKNLFHVLSKQKLENLKEFEFLVLGYTEEIDIEFINFFQNLKNLEKLSIAEDILSKSCELKVLNYLKNSCKTLTDYSLFSIINNYQEKFILEIFQNCTNLKKFHFEYFHEYPTTSFNGLIKGFKNCLSTIEIIHLTTINNFLENSFFSNNLQFENLKELLIEDQNLFYEYNEMLTEFIKSHKNSLIRLNLRFPDDCEVEEIFQSSSECYNLQKFTIFTKTIDLENVFSDSFFFRNHLLELIVHSSFFMEDLDKLFNILIKLKHLKTINLSSFNLTKFSIDKFLDDLNHSDSNIESIDLEGKYEDNVHFNIKTLRL